MVLQCAEGDGDELHLRSNPVCQTFALGDELLARAWALRFEDPAMMEILAALGREIGRNLPGESGRDLEARAWLYRSHRVTPMTISALWSHDGECRTYIHPSNGHPHAGECSGSWSDPEGKAGQTARPFPLAARVGSVGP